MEIGEGIVEINQMPIRGIVIETVYREITAFCILLYRAKEIVPAILEILLIRSECGHLDDLAAEKQMHDTESASDNPGIPEKALHLPGGERCCDIEILWLPREQHISDRATDDISFSAGLLYFPYRPEGIFIYLAIGYRMFLLRVDPGNRNTPSLSVILITYEHSFTLVEKSEWSN